MNENEDPPPPRRLTTISGIGAIVASALSRPSVRRNAFRPAAAISPHGLAWFRVSLTRRLGKPKQQARQQIPAQTADPRSALPAPPRAAKRDTPLGRWANELVQVALIASMSCLRRLPSRQQAGEGPPGRFCRHNEKGSPPQERRWRHRVWLFFSDAKRPSAFSRCFARG